MTEKSFKSALEFLPKIWTENKYEKENNILLMLGLLTISLQILAN